MKLETKLKIRGLVKLKDREEQERIRREVLSERMRAKTHLVLMKEYKIKDKEKILKSLGFKLERVEKNGTASIRRGSFKEEVPYFICLTPKELLFVLKESLRDYFKNLNRERRSKEKEILQLKEEIKKTYSYYREATKIKEFKPLKISKPSNLALSLDPLPKYLTEEQISILLKIRPYQIYSYIENKRMPKHINANFKDKKKRWCSRDFTVWAHHFSIPLHKPK